MTGCVAHIFRHPIKSHGREEVRSVHLTQGQTIPWDRRWAVAHEAAKTDGSGWAVCANFSRGSKAPALMAINATTDKQAGTVTLTHPDLDQLTLDPDHEADRLLNWVRPLMPQDRAQSARIVRVEGHGMTDTPYPSVSITSLASLAAVSARVGRDLSPLRWRGNIWLDGLEAWEEFSWLGKTIAIGQAQITIRERIRRCLATSANPETGERDVDTLGALNEGWDHQDFGVYGEVTKSGTIKIGDTAELL